jgi:anti-sigma28 factor (negative regulator of flagellin synthesis)
VEEIMRIEPTGSVAAAGDTQAVGRAPRSGAAEEAVQVSPSVGELGRASTRSQLERAQRIASLRSAVSNGTYQIDRARLAVHIAEEELARAGRT